MGNSERQYELQEPLVSVIIPAFRSDKTLWEAVKSVLHQKYHCIQLIVCDDGTDNFKKNELENAIQNENPSVLCTVIHQSENIGTVQNLNAGLEKATGDWILLLAADDTLADENVLFALIQQARQKDTNWIVPLTALCDNTMKLTRETHPTADIQAEIATGDMYALFKRLCLGCCLPSSGTLFRRRLLLEDGGFNSQYRLVEDWPLFLSLIRKGITPDISEKLVVLHRGGGVSRRQASKNCTYQRDLLNVMQTEILPSLSQLEEEDRRLVLQRIRDKEAIFQWRFSLTSKLDRFIWVLAHMDVILRRFVFRGNTK